MRGTTILAVIGILWAAAPDAAAHGHGHGHAPGHSSFSHAGNKGPMRPVEEHNDYVWLILLTQVGAPSNFFPGETGPGPIAPDLIIGGPPLGATDHLVTGPLVVPSIHLITHAVVPVEQGDTQAQHHTATADYDSDHSGAATAQPTPTANPSWRRPPGAAGPGAPVSGRRGPGVRGPGRPTRP
jgi:hypothetical protein